MRGYTGVAPAADLIAVRVGKKYTLENAYLLGLIYEWLDGVARDGDPRLAGRWQPGQPGQGGDERRSLAARERAAGRQREAGRSEEHTS